MPRQIFLELDTIPTFEEALQRGWIVRYTGSESGIVLFLSHRWLQKTPPHPDHDKVKLRGGKRMLQNRELQEVEYIWMDYFCIPQDPSNNEDQQLAIDSLPYYVRQCSHFVMLTATDSGVSVDDEESALYGVDEAALVVYESRGWCRLERFAAASPVWKDGKRIRDIKSWLFDITSNDLIFSPFSYSNERSRNPLEGVFSGKDKEITRIIPMVLRLCEYVDNNSGESLLLNISSNIKKTAEKHHTLPLALQQQAVRSMQETYGANAAWNHVLSRLDLRTPLTSIHFGSKGLSGSIPPELGRLTGLTELNLYSNSLTGSIPPELGRLTGLTVLHLCYNKLTGSIPPELGQLTGLTVLWLNDNSLTGSIPPELGQLTGLTELDLHDNSLTGSILPELGRLTGLTRLWLYSNKLTGSIPPELGQLTGLTELWLNDNKLTGVLPNGLRGVRGLYISGNAGLKKS